MLNNVIEGALNCWPIIIIIIVDRFNLESYEILYGLFEYTTVVPDIIDTVTKTCKCKIQ